jgi:hypothetical protein
MTAVFGAAEMAVMMQSLTTMAQAIASLQQDAATARTDAAGQNTEHRDRPERRVLDTRSWKVHVFEGKQTDWTEWSFQFTSAIRSSHPASYVAVKGAEKHDFDELVDVGPEDEKLSAELFDILVQHCKGDAGEIVRSIDERQGLTAWHKLYARYNPRTATRMIQIVEEVVSPPKIKDPKDFERGIRAWLEKEKILKTEFGQNLQDGIQTAIITNMLPTNIRDIVTMNITDS